MNKIKAVVSTGNVLIAILLSVAGIYCFTQSISESYTGCIPALFFSAGCVFCVAAIWLVLNRCRRHIYIETGSPISCVMHYYDIGQLEELTNFLDGKEGCDVPKPRQCSQIKVTMNISRDHRYAEVNVSVYTDFMYKDYGSMRIYEGDEAERVSKME
ncbi:MAG: hypothetical protein MJZ27_02750 [Bacteroidales bacterium]|nr:hypothetical protein [Bacteroidales bacterium]